MNNFLFIWFIEQVFRFCKFQATRRFCHVFINGIDMRVVHEVHASKRSYVFIFFPFINNPNSSSTS